MKAGAQVGSLAAVRDFRAVMATFAHDTRDALNTFDLEARRSLQWLVETVPSEWRQEVRRAEDAVTEAKIELERARHERLPGGESRSCLEERKALEQARRRHEFAQDKLEAVRKWGAMAEREVREYTGRARQLETLLDADVPKALALLDRILQALEAYVADVGMVHGVPQESAGSPEAEIEPAPTSDEQNVAEAMDSIQESQL